MKHFLSDIREMEPKYLTKNEVQLNTDILRTKNNKIIL